MPINTKEARREKFGPSLWISKAEAAAIADESIWKVDRKIERGEYIARKDENTGAVKIWRASVEKTPNKSQSSPPKSAA